VANSKTAGRGRGKRERLVAAAGQAIYEHGVEKSALADIAAVADVPLGNVYDYFKTKDALVSAVIEDYRQTFGELSAQVSQGEEPADRLKALLAALTERRERLALYGCRIGSLGSELSKRDDDLRAGVGAIMTALIDWAEVQFLAMGRDDARELATALIAAYEGIAVLAAALRDPGLISTETSRLSRWIDSLAEPQPAVPGAVKGA
jgi:TetR/AcrR family transcriptional regulator, transcriptional repressor for nem operon